MLYAIIIIMHLLVSALLIGVVLMQSGRGGGGLAGAFGGGGGGGNQTLFGGRGATTFLTKTTWILGSGFMITSLVLALAIGRRGGTSEERSLLQENPIEVPAQTAAQPLTPLGTLDEPTESSGQPAESGTETPSETGGN